MSNKYFIGVMVYFCLVFIMTCWGTTQFLTDNTPENRAELEAREDWRLSRASSTTLVILDDTTLKEGIIKSIFMIVFFIVGTYYVLKYDKNEKLHNNTN